MNDNEVIQERRPLWLPLLALAILFVGAPLSYLTMLTGFTIMAWDDSQTGHQGDTCYHAEYTPTEGEQPNMDLVALADEIATKRGVSQKVRLALFETALVESRFRNLANDGLWGPEDTKGTPSKPEDVKLAGRSMQYPNDGTGSDHASMNLLQQQPWWAPTLPNGDPDIETLMDPAYAIGKYLDRATELEPTVGGSPGTLAQTVQGSQFPDRYDQHEDEALELIRASRAGETNPTPRPCPTDGSEGGEGREIGDLGSGEWTHPLPGGRLTSGYGYRGCGGLSVCNELISNHHGLDFATLTSDPPGTIVAPTDLEITAVVNSNDWNGSYIMGRTPDGHIMNFHHIALDSALVQKNDVVAVGTPLATEGDTGMSDGRHLHWQVMKPGAPDSYPSAEHAIDPTDLAIEHGILDPRDPNL